MSECIGFGKGGMQRYQMMMLRVYGEYRHAGWGDMRIRGWGWDSKVDKNRIANV